MNDCDTFTKIAQEWGRWGKIIVAKGFKKLPKIQNIAQSGHTGSYLPTVKVGYSPSCTVYIVLAFYKDNSMIDL